jgi:Trypsin
VGTYSFKHHDGSILLDVTQQIRHPNWERRSDDDDYFVNDFLLLKLNQTVPKSGGEDGDGAVPILRLNRDNHLPRHMEPVLAMGVGNTDRDDGDSRSDVLRQVTLSAISGDACNTYHDDDRDITYEGRISNCHLCTRGGEGPDTKDTWYVFLVEYVVIYLCVRL